MKQKLLITLGVLLLCPAIVLALAIAREIFRSQMAFPVGVLFLVIICAAIGSKLIDNNIEE